MELEKTISCRHYLAIYK